ncbi:MAG: HypC/HybG/HupF family hydrogenase formation chaperone [Dehalococcoidia bacterium]|nr:HypC/HybG/HupF family hydrogenase formation chaperone [Dehalococcoidia bacterium]
MCLGIPARIRSIGGGSQAEVELGGVVRGVDLTLVPEARIGDYVLVHVGFAIQLIDEGEALETLRLLQELAGCESGAPL